MKLMNDRITEQAAGNSSFPIDTFGIGRVEVMCMEKGAVYEYVSEMPSGRRGHLYQCLDRIRHEPVGQWLVLVQCLTGPDEGIKFCASPANFARRYRLATQEHMETMVQLAYAETQGG